MSIKKQIFPTLAALFCLVCCNGAKGQEESAAPAVPSGISLREATESSLAIQWNVSEGATSYDWKLLKDGAEAKSGHTSGRSVIISGLEASTAYRFSVRSLADGKASDWSAYVDMKTQGSTEPSVDPGGAEKYDEFGIPSWEEDGKPRAFPGAQGGGMYTSGGRGGKVYHVTSLEDNASAAGTLRYGIEKESRPLTIVFDVAGIIELSKQLNVTKGDLTIAGQTAPGDGICLKNYTFRISASNVIVRFIRCRMGDEKKTEDDAIQVMSHTDGAYKNIIIDHCSVSWSTDECASFYGMTDFSFQWNIISESLRVSVHEKGTHGYGGIWGGENASYHHNLLAHHDSRNPRIDHDYVSTQKGPLSIVNNVVYNWRGNTCYGGESANNTGTYRKYNILANYYKPGPATQSNHIWFLDPTTSCSNCSDLHTGPIVPGHFYMDGNYMYGKSAMSENNWSGTTASSNLINTIKASEAFKYDANPTSISIHSAQDAFEAVLNWSGASLKRDRIDVRIADEARNGTAGCKGSKSGIAGLIDTQSDAGGWPEYSYDSEVHDSDGDGMPDAFEVQFGLNKSNAADGAAKGLDKHGRYTNLEMYLHYLVRDIVAAQNEKGTYTKL
ncbi:MAG: pectate lyase [Bacteroidales bacterium]|nr:pectate lyase [Bacteroidales bacterium]